MFIIHIKIVHLKLTGIILAEESHINNRDIIEESHVNDGDIIEESHINDIVVSHIVLLHMIFTSKD